MAAWLGDKGRAKWAKDTHAQLAKGFERLWDTKRKRYIDSLGALARPGRGVAARPGRGDRRRARARRVA